jgi:monofunctional biosynthetic peptidoglycan transglycosylase
LDSRDQEGSVGWPESFAPEPAAPEAAPPEPAAPEPAAPEPAAPEPGPLPVAAPPAESADEPAPRRRFTFKRLALGLFAVLVAYLLFEIVTWPDVAALAKENPSTTAFIEAYKDQQAAEGKKAAADFRFVPSSRISEAMKRAAVCGEDLEFFSHRGFSEHELKEAFKEAIEDGKKLRGASTITQQLAKNLWLSPSRNPLRKVKEAILTRQLENKLSKGRILELYLNVAEFGPGVYGAEAAARRYFGTSAASLGESQAAALAAGLPSPKRWNPSAGSKTARKRADIILARMAQAQWLRQLV